MIKKNTRIFNNIDLAELHVHVGGATDPALLWHLAHEQGIKLPTKDFWQFVKLFTINKKKIKWEDFHELFHWTELIQSSPQAIERCIHELISGAYRNCNITLLELSFNPMFRNRGGERDLDHIIAAAIRGMEKALLEYPQVKAGLIFFLDRRLSVEKNEIIVQKAIKYKHRGVVGIDLAGMTVAGRKLNYQDYRDCYRFAKKNQLGTVVHAGEEEGINDIEKAIKYLNPQRIIHGIQAYQSPKLLAKIKERQITLAICPTSNLKIDIYQVDGFVHFRKIFKSFIKAGIKFCINTDDPEFFQINLGQELTMLLKHNVLTKKEILAANKTAFNNSFIKLRGDEK